MDATSFDPKDFRQQHFVDGEWKNGAPDSVVRLPYRLPDLHAKDSPVVWWVEGEKDADLIRRFLRAAKGL